MTKKVVKGFSWWNSFNRNEWKEHYEIANTRLQSFIPFRRDSILENNASKALSLALKKNNPEQLALTYILISHYYMETNHPDWEKIFDKSIQASEKFYGPNSAELAEQLALLAVKLEFAGRFPESMKLNERATDIFEATAIPRRTLESIDAEIDVAWEMGDFEKVERCVERALHLIETADGVTSSDRFYIGHYEQLREEVRDCYLEAS